MDIRVNDLCKSFGDKKVLDHLSLTFPEGKVSCIMGPSGCGKTTLLNILMGFLEADSGSVEAMPAEKSAVFQEDRLFEEFSALTNVMATAAKTVTAAEAGEHLSRVGLGDSRNVRARELSGGMRRRVALVRAMLAESKVLFLDEPFKGLDEETKKTILEYVKEAVAGKTVIFVTHDDEEASALAEQLIRLEPIEAAAVES
ncbi:MAG: ATP-binding cassette domain-containing protein [Clostridiales bacterium]|nr:ATP-binding cassette domain-containing protein [Clostridiales bacterium]